MATGFGPAFDPWFNLAIRETETRRAFAVVRIKDGAVVGSTSFLDPMPPHRRVEIGHTWYSPAVWSSAVNPESKLLMLTYAFESWGMTRVSFNVDAINLRSQAAVAKLGGVREGILRQHAVVHTGRVRDTVVFSILTTEWPVVRERLTERLVRPTT